MYRKQKGHPNLTPPRLWRTFLPFLFKRECGIRLDSFVKTFHSFWLVNISTWLILIISCKFLKDTLCLKYFSITCCSWKSSGDATLRNAALVHRLFQIVGTWGTAAAGRGSLWTPLSAQRLILQRELSCELPPWKCHEPGRINSSQERTLEVTPHPERLCHRLSPVLLRAHSAFPKTIYSPLICLLHPPSPLPIKRVCMLLDLTLLSCGAPVYFSPVNLPTVGLFHRLDWTLRR